MQPAFAFSSDVAAASPLITERFDACPCCESKKLYAVWQNRTPQAVTHWKNFMFGGRRFFDRVMGCRTCGFRYLEPIVAGDCFYHEADHAEYHALSDARLRYFSEVKVAIQKRGYNLSQNARVLDLGAGEGDWLTAWPEIAGRYATEMQPEFILHMQAQGISVQSTIENTTENFDMISAFDFLEHVANPKPLLQQINSKLSLGGMLVIGVPDMGKLLARLLGTRYYLYCPMHYSYFTRNSLHKLLSQYFTQVDIFESPPMRATLKAVAKWVLPNLQHPALGHVWLPVGYRASLIALARKSS